MRRWIAFTALAALISGCVASSSPEPTPGSATAAQQPAATAVPAGTVSDVTYVAWRDPGFTVIKSATADELFSSVATCTSHEGGYTVEYPVSWHTNEGGEAPGCSWFGPEPFANAPATLVAVTRPLDIPIQIGVSRRGLAQVGGGPPPPLDDQVVIGGVEGSRTEAEIRTEPPWWRYAYNASLDPAADGLTFMAQTTSAWEDEWRDYVLNKAVLDRMMATLEFASRAEGAKYVAKEGYAFTVIESAEADTLFETPDTCTNPVAGYTVTFPDDWYTNTEIGEVPACSWFTPDYFEVIDPAEAPDEIWISIGTVDGVVAYTSLTQIILSEELLLGGMTARRVESNPHPNDRPNYRGYDYHVIMGSPDQGPSLLALVDSDAAGDYELGKAVLDRIMESLEFEVAP